MEKMIELAMHVAKCRAELQTAEAHLAHMVAGDASRGHDLLMAMVEIRRALRAAANRRLS